MFKKLVKNERGLTLIELLAVVVILGIIAAIAIPAIGGLIDNSKKDAHLANAKQLANAARLYVTTENSTVTTTGTEVSLATLVTNGHMEDIKDPSSSANAKYDSANTKVIVKKTSGNNYQYFVKLQAAAPATGNASVYIDEVGTGGSDINDLTRTDVKN